jgi:hypothetical protein
MPKLPFLSLWTGLAMGPGMLPDRYGFGQRGRSAILSFGAGGPNILAPVANRVID